MAYTVQYYDLVLAAVLASVAAGAAVAYFTPVSTVAALLLACGVAAAVIYHAIFVNGPVDGVEDLTREVERLGPTDLSD